MNLPRLLGLALLCLLSGCVVVPVGMFTESPYRPEVLAKLSQADADRFSVQQILGSPKFVKDRNRYWFYYNERVTAGILGGTGSAVISDFEWLAIQFDASGHVAFVGLASDIDKCLENGVCFNGTAPSAEDSVARNFAPKEDQCAVYLFLESLPWYLNTGSAVFAIDGRKIGSLNKNTYLFLEHPAGEIEIGAYDLTISTRCMGGSRLYVRAIKKKDFSWETGEDLAVVDQAAGEEAIRMRKRALPD